MLTKMAVSFMFLFSGVCGTFSTFEVELIATAEDSVYSTRCFRVMLNLCRIQVFVNFPYGFIYSFYVVFFFQNATNAVSYFVDIWKNIDTKSAFLHLIY